MTEPCGDLNCPDCYVQHYCDPPQDRSSGWTCPECGARLVSRPLGEVAPRVARLKGRSEGELVWVKITEGERR